MKNFQIGDKIIPSMFYYVFHKIYNKDVLNTINSPNEFTDKQFRYIQQLGLSSEIGDKLFSYQLKEVYVFKYLGYINKRFHIYLLKGFDNNNEEYYAKIASASFDEYFKIDMKYRRLHNINKLVNI